MPSVNELAPTVISFELNAAPTVCECTHSPESITDSVTQPETVADRFMTYHGQLFIEATMCESFDQGCFAYVVTTQQYDFIVYLALFNGHLRQYTSMCVIDVQ